MLIERLRPANGILLRLLFFFVVVGLCLAPWVQNRAYLRDFMDYGLVMAASARMEAGQTPYRDFVTPIQSFTLWANHLMESWLGGTYQAMTKGNGLAIVVSLVGLAALLRARMNSWLAGSIAGVVVITALSQHTIIWYNGVGVICLSVVAWGAAVQPVVGRHQWWISVAVGLALVLGGMNKLNFHLLGLAIALAWTFRAALLARASWRLAGATIAVWLTAGVLIPLGLELSISGTEWAVWRHSVIDLALQNRGNLMYALLTPSFYLEPFHDFYGSVWLPQVGLITAIWSAILVGVQFRSKGGVDRVMLIGAAGVMILGVGGLLATNHEIVYVTLGATIALAVALQLGFSDTQSKRALRWVLLMPTLAIGSCAWWSAWQGQRSQFGFSPAPQESYIDISKILPEFGYLTGTLIPPEHAASFQTLRDKVTDQVAYPHFYGPGTEWLERIWPAVTPSKLPLWSSPLSYGPLEQSALIVALSAPSPFDLFLISKDWYTYLPASVSQALNLRAYRSELGVLDVYTLRKDDIGESRFQDTDSIELINLLRGNLAPAHIMLGSGIALYATEDGYQLIGSLSGQSSWRFTQPVNRLTGTVRLERRAGDPSIATSARFIIESADSADVSPIWTQEILLPANAQMAEMSYELDTWGKPLRFTTILSDAAEEKSIIAGWLMPRIQHSSSRQEAPPDLRVFTGTKLDLSEGEIHTWGESRGPQLRSVQLRDGQLQNGEITLAPGGEIWIRPEGGVSAMTLDVSELKSEGATAPAVIRTVWYGGGRLELLQQAAMEGQPGHLSVRGWAAEPDGWFGLLVDSSSQAPGVRVALTKIEP